MHYFILFVLIPACILAEQVGTYSFSPPVGSGSGSSYALTGQTRITAIRVWEYYNNYITGIQIRHDFTWSNTAGFQYGYRLEMELRDDEYIIQISGKYGHYLQSVIFVTNKGRSLYAGQPSGHSFNMYPEHPDAELLFISGRYHGAVTSIAAHWGTVSSSTGNSTNH